MDRHGWDDRYRTSEFVWSTEPNRFLRAEAEGLPPGRAVDLACGEGRNAVWLATLGWTVTGVDFSAVGVDKGRSLAEANGVDVEWVVADATSWERPGRYDLVAVCYLQLPADQRRTALSHATRDLAPGGTLVVVGHDLSNLTEGVGGPQDPAVLFTPDDVVGDLRAARVDGLVVERAERVERPVETAAGTATAIDCLVRARRDASHLA
jgi:SAM-dependent methyltransferase